MKLNFPAINRTWLMLVAALVLGLLAMFLTVQYLKLQERSIKAEVEASMRGKGETVSVVVPTSDLPAGTPIDLDRVASRKVPADLVYDDAVLESQFDQYKGQALLRPVKQGRPILKSDLRPIYADFAGSLKSGTRAMTIETDELNSIAHMVQPGNLIDLMLVMSQSSPTEANNPAGSKDNKVVVPFMLGVKVLATGQKIVRDAPAGEGSLGAQRFSYNTYTLEVTPAQAINLLLAQELGKLRVALRNDKDGVEGKTPSQEYTSDGANALMADIATRSQAAIQANASLGARLAATARASAQAQAVSAGGDMDAYIEYIIGGKGGGGVSPTLNVAMPPGLVTATGSPTGQVIPVPQLPANVAPTAAAVGLSTSPNASSK